MTNSQFPNDLGETVPSERLWLRSELMGTQVITRDSGRRLGVVGEVVVDIDRREIVALGLRDNPLRDFYLDCQNGCYLNVFVKLEM